jgi:hypothetical protein
VTRGSARYLGKKRRRPIYGLWRSRCREWIDSIGAQLKDIFKHFDRHFRFGDSLTSNAYQKSKYKEA